MSNLIDCLNKCGFYGKVETLGMCSKCYREAMQGMGGPIISSKPVAEGKQSTIRIEKDIKGVKLQVRIGDMTEEKVDAIVNAANSSLDHASGLAGAIVKKGGKSIQDESDYYVASKGRLEEGGIAVTKAGNLPCKWVIHAVGPVWHGGVAGEEMMLSVAIRGCFEHADKLGCTSIAIPAISSGIFGFPKDKCAQILFEMAESYISTEKKLT